MNTEIKIIKQLKPNGWMMGDWSYNYPYKQCATTALRDGADAFFVSYGTEELLNLSVKDELDLSTDEKFIETLGKDILNYSYDGAGYWLPKEVMVQCLSDLEKWFKNPLNHSVDIDSGMANCLIVRETPNGLFILDTTVDFGSSFSEFIEPFVEFLPEDLKSEVLVIEDCHLINHLYLGRGQVQNEKELFLKLYQEKILNELFVFDDNIEFESFSKDDLIEDLGTNKVVLLGNFQFIDSSCNVAEFLTNLGFEVVPEMQEDSIVLVGNLNEFVMEGFRKVEELNLEVYSLDKFIEYILDYYE